MTHAHGTCRSCGCNTLETILDLGESPLADRFPSEEQLRGPEPFYPLKAAFCTECSLVQILETVPPEVLFCDSYPYYSSFSPKLLEHSRENVLDIIKQKPLGEYSLVVELASNDGYLLRNYVEHGIPVLGIDPADGPAAKAREVGVETMNTFFTSELADSLVADGHAADVIHANNVLAHVADTNGFVNGIARLLKDDGVLVVEAPHVLKLVEHCEFDTMYHEHLCYFSVLSLDNLFRRHGLFLNRLKQLDIHGGSLRLFVEKHERVDRSVSSLLEHERSLGLDTVAYYARFGHRVEELKDKLNALLSDLKEQGKRIAAYGAAAKGTTMINYCGIGPDTIDFVVDRNTYKQGRFMPGQHIPIRGPEELTRQQPDFVLLLAWNFAREIISQQQQYLDAGGRFIVPVPEPKILESVDQVPISV
ncbi:MAG: methyltransferase domain-containing protein [Chitinivibrionales bacterium]|nr:methyltransferase domain-containing protein [Chitinivibrionales bacterium]